MQAEEISQRHKYLEYRQKQIHQQQVDELKRLQKLYQTCLQDVGSSHREAAKQVCNILCWPIIGIGDGSLTRWVTHYLDSQIFWYKSVSFIVFYCRFDRKILTEFVIRNIIVFFLTKSPYYNKTTKF